MMVTSGWRGIERFFLLTDKSCELLGARSTQRIALALIFL